MCQLDLMLCEGWLWAPPRTVFHQECAKRCEPEHASRDVSAPVPGVMVPVWQGVASLWQPREEKLLLVFLISALSSCIV